eukprot:TRINITY_DN121727_c0_g1_i1.p1 TRINITY_DN121727_c0_g1~~TRINITY_DN121727_c0_g1_i1.p1  ORF type:complete len:720 (+),score=96.87 TRINITY_DN121727_c0_g1_i1:74-2233(+)
MTGWKWPRSTNADRDPASGWQWSGKERSSWNSTNAAHSSTWSTHADGSSTHADGWRKRTRREKATTESGTGVAAESAAGGAGPKATAKVAKVLERAEQARTSPAGCAKAALIRFREQLTQKQREELLARIGLARANDVASLDALKQHFDADMCKLMDTLQDDAWLFQDPTFSWLSGFYWHMEAASLPQLGSEVHSPFYCHLCEVDAWSKSELDGHLVTNRHAENCLAWAKSMGATDLPSSCGRCPASSSTSSSAGAGHWAGRREAGESWEELHDLEHRRARSGLLQVVEESSPPVGFTSNYEGDRGKALAVPYISVSLDVGSQAAGVRVIATIPIGPKVKGKKGQWYVELFWCSFNKVWKSLAIPLYDKQHWPVSGGAEVKMWMSVRWNGASQSSSWWQDKHDSHKKQQDSKDEQSWEDFKSPLTMPAPQAGHVLEQQAEADFRAEVWRRTRSRQVPLLDFVGHGQVRDAGGAEALHGQQIPLQVATEDLIISFLLYVPEESGPHPLLVFFHGDMDRGTSMSPQPGICGFATEYGPAQLAVDPNPKKRGHVCRRFAVVTPCCSEEYFWLRHGPHDSKAYAPSMERCLRSLCAVVFDQKISCREWGTCFAGQSMGAYMALEISRAMPEHTAAVVALAPCFDACRLDHLAKRLINVPVWVLIGRNDALCSFEECASLALKMRDLDARCVRLTSLGIKGHSEVGKHLDKPKIYEWMLGHVKR